jgi:hypothetical protein
MLSLLKRREVKTLLRRVRSPSVVARAAGVSVSSVKRIAKEPDVKHLDDAAERRRRRIGRPSIAREFHDLVVELRRREPGIRPIEIYRRIRLLGYTGGRTALYALVGGLALARPAIPVAADPTGQHGGSGSRNSAARG